MALGRKIIEVLVVIILFSLSSVAIEKGYAQSNVIRIDGGKTVNERTMLPLRSIFENLNASVDWENSTQTVTAEKGNNKILLKINSSIANVNGDQQKLDVPAKLINNNTYVPVRFVSEALGAKVDWNEVTSTVTIGLDGKTLVVPVGKQAASSSVAKLDGPFSSTHKTFKVNDRKIYANIVTIDINNSKISLDIGIAHNKIGSVEDLDSIAKQNNAIIAINGTFFNAYTDDSFKQPYGYIMKNGTMLNKGESRAVFAFDSQSQPTILSGDEFKKRQNDFIGAVQAGPTLIRDGQKWIHPAEEGHSDPKILTNVGSRSAIGITSDNKLILVTTNGVLITDLAEVMVQLGAYNAMNLDGGASSCLYYNGKYVTPPGRQISNAILFQYQP